MTGVSVADSMTYPKRLDGLEINPAEGGFIIYQAEKDRVHFLNHTAVLILELCDGRRSPDEIGELVKAAFALERLPERTVEEALARLRHEGLVAE
ncbi:MAG: PqqD family protein [Candidatus Rokubacteria bacterium]|nr:PqqD family protein [Candidatus Rokubacteria bacterium]